MIGRLTGILAVKRPPQVWIDVHGVAYECDAPLSSFYVWPLEGQPVVAYTHLVVREDAQLLYAFASVEERSAFRQLIKISGIGPKVALSVLSGLSVDELSRAVMNKDIALFIKIPGIGRKTAERLVIELSDRRLNAEGSATSDVKASARSEAIAALSMLGYKETEIQSMLKNVDASLEPQEQIRLSLKGSMR